MRFISETVIREHMASVDVHVTKDEEEPTFIKAIKAPEEGGDC